MGQGPDGNMMLNSNVNQSGQNLVRIPEILTVIVSLCLWRCLCVYMYICVHVYVYAYAYAYVYVYVYVCLCPCVIFDVSVSTSVSISHTPTLEQDPHQQQLLIQQRRYQQVKISEMYI
jgi:hypothetical protein